MTKTLLLKLPDDVHEALKEHQMDRITEKRKHVTLNELLIELVKSGTTSVNETAAGILRRAAAKSEG
jgi:hypothetical protein